MEMINVELKSIREYSKASVYVVADMEDVIKEKYDMEDFSFFTVYYSDGDNELSIDRSNVELFAEKGIKYDGEDETDLLVHYLIGQITGLSDFQYHLINENRTILIVS